MTVVGLPEEAGAFNELSDALDDTAREIDEGNAAALARAGEFFNQGDVGYCCPLQAIMDCEALADELRAMAEEQ